MRALVALLACLALSACGAVAPGSSDPCERINVTVPACLWGKGGPNDK